MAPRARTWLLVSILLLAGCAGASVVPAPDAGGPTASGGAGTAGTSTATPHPATMPTVTVTVTSVIDGDTLKVAYANGTAETVRLLGVDTPETRGDTQPDEFEGVPSTTAGRDCLARWGDRASAAASEQLSGETVRLGFDPRADRRGYYGRLLAYVWVDGAQFNYRLIRQGYARLYDSEFVERARYGATERRARSELRGVWGCATPSDAATTAPKVPLGVSVHANAAGNDHENLDDEYVTLTNRGDRALNLTGWRVADEAGHTYEFTAETRLEPGASLRIYTGSGEDNASARYWGRDRAVWNNGGDTVTVRDGSGMVVREYRYG